MHESGQFIGDITELHLYRVKSMQGESLSVAQLSLKGVVGDRQYAFVKSGRSNDGFPWLTGRDFPDMVLFKPRRDEQTGEMQVELPDGRVFPLVSDELRDVLQAGATRNPAIHLMRLNRGAYDGFPVSLMGAETVRAVTNRSGIEEDTQRYRPNIVVETTLKREGAEDEWLGGIVTLGERADSPQIFIVDLNERCMMINIDPKTGKQTPRVLGDVARNRGKDMGVYASVVRAGEMRVGEPIFLSRLV